MKIMMTLKIIHFVTSKHSLGYKALTFNIPQNLHAYTANLEQILHLVVICKAKVDLFFFKIR